MQVNAKANFTINKHHNHYKDFVIGTGVFLISFFIAGVLAPVESSDAITCTSGSTGTEGEICSTAGTDVSVTIEETVYSISVSSSHGSSDTPVSMSYTEDSGNKLGDVVVASDTVTTTTNSPLDHYLYISTNSSSNKLTNEDSIDSNPKTYIAPGGGNTIDTAEALTNDTWGFALPSATSGIPTNSFDDSYTSDSISSSSKFTKVPVLDNDILVQKEVGTVDEDTGLNTSTADIYYGTKATSSLYAGTYANTIKYTVYAEVPKDEPETLKDLEYMQDLADYPEVCENTPVADTDGNNIYTLKDNRDNKEYKVAHQADGNCWMVQNLALDGADSTGATRVLHTTDSDVTQDRTLAPNATSGMSYSEIKIYSQYTDNTTSTCSDSTPYCVLTNELYGNLYNWYTATATTGTLSVTSGDAKESICPKGWRLPQGGNNSTVDKSWAKLFNDTGLGNGGNTSGATGGGYVKMAQVAPLFIPLAGVYNDGYILQATRGYYQSRTTSSRSDFMRDFVFSASADGLFYPDAGDGGKLYGYSVRCVSSN